MGRPKHTGSTLTHGFAVDEPLPKTYSPALRGYFRLRQRAPGSITTDELRRMFGASGMTIHRLRAHLDDLAARDLLTYEPIPRGEHTSLAITLLDNEAAAKIVADVEDRDESSIVSDFIALWREMFRKWRPENEHPFVASEEYKLAALLLASFDWKIEKVVPLAKVLLTYRVEILESNRIFNRTITVLWVKRAWLAKQVRQDERDKLTRLTMTPEERREWEESQERARQRGNEEARLRKERPELFKPKLGERRRRAARLRGEVRQGA